MKIVAFFYWLWMQFTALCILWVHLISSHLLFFKNSCQTQLCMFQSDVLLVTCRVISAKKIGTSSIESFPVANRILCRIAYCDLLREMLIAFIGPTINATCERSWKSQVIWCADVVGVPTAAAGISQCTSCVCLLFEMSFNIMYMNCYFILRLSFFFYRLYYPKILDDGRSLNWPQ